MSSSGRQRWAWMVVVLLLAACTEFPVRPADVGVEGDDAADVGGDAPLDADTGSEDAGDAGNTCLGDGDCDDGAFCNGREVCSPADPAADARGCVPGDAPSLDDGIDCTADGCDEGGDQILHDPSACACLVPGSLCDCARDPEVCPSELGVCSEVRCSDVLTCVAGPVEAGQSCDDGVACTQDDVCDAQGACGGQPVDAACDDDLFCNGEERCVPSQGDAASGCIPGVPPPLSDGLDCTDDSCDEDADEVVHIARGCQPCQEDEQCVPDNPVVCQRYVCADGVCGAQAAPANTACNDGLLCTGNDVCDAHGRCGGTPNDAACNDGVWCDGIETCQPGADGADGAGCVGGIVPALPDGIPCTQDVCVECDGNGCTPGLTGTFRYEPGPGCECVVAGDCDADLCQVPLCDQGTYTCSERPALRGTSCEDPDPCVAGGVCSGDGVCEGGEDVCDCLEDEECPVDGACQEPRCVDRRCTVQQAEVGVACDTDNECLAETQCDEQGQCVGIFVCECEFAQDCPVSACAPDAACVEGACVYDYADAGVACGDFPACAAGRCTGEGECAPALDHALCNVACNAGVCDPDDADADDRGCTESDPLDDGTPCVPVDCEEASGGVCFEGECLPNPEGPTGTAACFDGADNDCDGDEDSDDKNCLVATTLDVQAPPPQPTGLNANPIPVVAVPFSGNDLMGDQRRNLYCTANHLEYEQAFDFGATAIDPFITALDGGIPGEDIVEVQQGDTVGVRLCNDKGIDVGPFAFPALDGDATLGFLVEVELQLDGDAPFQPGEHLVVAYRTERLPAGDFIPLVALGNDSEIPSDQRHRFLIDNIAGSQLLTIRLQPMTLDGTACGFVDALRIMTIPRLAPAGERPADRSYVSWALDEQVVTTAYEGFENTELDSFFEILAGSVSLELHADAQMLGATGLEWGHRNSTPFGVIGLPEIQDQPPTYDRANPLVWDLGASTDDTNYRDDRELVHFIVGPSTPSGNLVAGSSVPEEVPWVVTHLGMSSPDKESFRHMMVLPERMKVADSHTLGFRGQFDDLDADSLIDEVHVYWFDRPAETDVTVEALGPVLHDADAQFFQVRSSRPGEVMIRCYWQVPDDGSFRTVESNRAYMTFQ